ncbi:hypothetical protein NP493_419g03026 [Ridgeia piscesae]|uniref:Uncharacterized protein n=1 Tax=Ridgeia piscesae TaxID=27915 RepID=A0AAD9L1D5_RIDPI|nr:hypothetical protein NP493_419g03026 [Ridgeia piscesae]
MLNARIPTPPVNVSASMSLLDGLSVSPNTVDAWPENDTMAARTLPPIGSMLTTSLTSCL